jgi:deoxyinosine 3'endonuclease (endonuclease V)
MYLKKPSIGVATDYLPSNEQKEKPAQNVQVRDENDNIVVLDDETRDLIDSLRSKPEMKMLFSVSKNATKEDIIKAVKIIEALKDHKEGEV